MNKILNDIKEVLQFILVEVVPFANAIIQIFKNRKKQQ